MHLLLELPMTHFHYLNLLYIFEKREKEKINWLI